MTRPTPRTVSRSRAGGWGWAARPPHAGKAWGLTGGVGSQTASERGVLLTPQGATSRPQGATSLHRGVASPARGAASVPRGARSLPQESRCQTEVDEAAVSLPRTRPAAVAPAPRTRPAVAEASATDALFAVPPLPCTPPPAARRRCHPRRRPPPLPPQPPPRPPGEPGAPAAQVPSRRGGNVPRGACVGVEGARGGRAGRATASG